ncbi:MAG TPA: hypothetical protein VE843_03600, partial [Ktedonobacteraceae bacterium]|nr:hypothetical protein [Ktedonobacteraceae bacterium]
ASEESRCPCVRFFAGAQHDRWAMSFGSTFAMLVNEYVGVNSVGLEEMLVRMKTITLLLPFYRQIR